MSQFKPPDEKSLKSKYDQNCPLYAQLAEEVKYILSKAIKANQIQTSPIESRVKEFDSFYTKIIRYEITSDPFDTIEDMVGVRVICLYRTDVDAIGELIKGKFDVIEEKRAHGKGQMPFGYMSDHYIIKLPDSYSGERYDSIKSLKCEIQVRTVSMHAWDAVSHHLDYKKDVDIPSHLRNDFYALSGVFYIADSLFEQFRNAREESIKNIMKNIRQDTFDLHQEINLDTLRAFLTWKFPQRTIPQEEVHIESEAVSILVSALKEFDIDFMRLDKLIDNNKDWLEEREQVLYKDKTPYFNRVGATVTILKEEVTGFGKHFKDLYSLRKQRTSGESKSSENANKEHKPPNHSA